MGGEEAVYIPPFWCGVIVGAGVEFAVLVVVAMCYGKKNRR